MINIFLSNCLFFIFIRIFAARKAKSCGFY
jgi:hypothetical protein